MGILKKEPNPVGRPSKESLKKKRNQKILVGVLATVAVLLVGGTVLLIATGTDLTNLMGNSVTKTVRVCPTDSSYNKTTKQCEYTTSLKDACPTGGYTYKDGKCQKQVSSTSGIQATYDSKTKTYKCPADSKTSTTITKYVKTGQKTCIKNVYHLGEAYGACREEGAFVRGNECVVNTNKISYNVSEKSPDFNISVSANSSSFFATVSDYEFYLTLFNTKIIKGLKDSNDVKAVKKKVFIDMYEVKNGKYTLYETKSLYEGNFSVKFPIADFDSSRTFMFKYRFIDDTTGKTISTNYMNKVVLSPEKYPTTPRLNLKKGYLYVEENHVIGNTDYFYTTFPSDVLAQPAIVEYYEVVGGEYKYIKQCPFVTYNNHKSECLKPEPGKKYSARVKAITKNRKFTYTNFSNILTVSSTKPSS